MANMSQTGTLFTALSALMTFIGTIAYAVAFGTDYWLVSDGRDRPFVRIGMHHACFNKCTLPYCPGGAGFVWNGCSFLYSEYFEEIRKWILQDWYLQVRYLAISAVPLTGVTMICSLLAAAVVGCWRYPHNKPPARNILLQALLFISSGLQFVSALLLLSVLAMFYMKCFNKDWMPIPEKNSLGFSYWLIVVAALFIGFAFVISLAAGLFKALRMRKGPTDPQLAEDMMLGRT